MTSPVCAFARPTTRPRHRTAHDPLHGPSCRHGRQLQVEEVAVRNPTNGQPAGADAGALALEWFATREVELSERITHLEGDVATYRVLALSGFDALRDLTVR